MASVICMEATHDDVYAPAPATYPDRATIVRRNPTRLAFGVLQLAFIAAPILAGIDKFTHILVNWDKYLAPVVVSVLPFDGHTFMMIVGVVEIAAGLLVAFRPRIGGYVVAAWLTGIILNLLIHPMGYYDIALRDLGLAMGAFAMAKLAKGLGKK
jgi:hypothetical protein